MKFGSTVSEASRNVSSGATKAVGWAMTLLALGGSTYLSDEVQAIHVVVSAYEFDAAGGSILTVRTDRAVDAGRCLSLSTVPGIHASLALRFTDTADRAVSMPDAPMPLVEVRGDAATLLGVGLVSSSGVLLPRTLASQLGAREGETLALASGEHAAIQGVFEFPEDGRDGRLGNSLVAPVSDTREFDECWIHLRPYDARKADLLMFATDPDRIDASLPQTSQLNTTVGTDPGLDARFVHRASRAANAAGTTLGLVLGFVAVWIRRLELSTSIKLGVRKPVLAIQVIGESLAWIIPGLLLLWAIGFGLVRSTLHAPDASSLISHFTMQCLVYGLAIVVGAISAVSLISPRLQYQYLRDR